MVPLILSNLLFGQHIQQCVFYQVLWALAVTGQHTGTLSQMLANAIGFGMVAATAIKTILTVKRNACKPAKKSQGGQLAQ